MNTTSSPSPTHLPRLAHLFACVVTIFVSACAGDKSGSAAASGPNAIVGKWQSGGGDTGGDYVNSTYVFSPDGTGVEHSTSSQAGLKSDNTMHFRWVNAGPGKWTSQYQEIPWKCEYRLSGNNLVMRAEGGGFNGVLTLTRAR